jgi:BolA protein
VSRKERIEERLTSDLSPVHLAVVDESNRHSVPAGAESHFNVTVVSEEFADMMRVERHRRIHELLDSELKGGLHALTLTLLTPAEFEKKVGGAGGEVKGASIASPNCMGGSKAAK